MKKFFMYGAFALLSIAAVSCHGDDPMVDGNGTTSPVIRTTNTLSGYVTDANGDPIAGATVTCDGKTVTTNADGYYEFDNVPTGTNTVTVTADGTEQTREVVVTEDGETSTSASSSFTIFKTTPSTHIKNGQYTSVMTDYASINPEAECKIEAELENGTFDDNDVEIWITPIYTELSADVTRALSVNTFLLGAKINISNPNAEVKKDIKVTFNLDQSMTGEAKFKEYKNGQWVNANYTIEGDKVVIKTKEISSLGIFADIVTNEKTTTTPLTFSQSQFNNINGSSSMKLSPVTFTYKSGVDFTTSPANKLQAFILDTVARVFGVKVQNVTGSYQPADRLNAGWAIDIYGHQYVYNCDAVCGLNNTVKYTRYDNAEVWAKSWNRDHNGGGSK